MLTEKLEAIMLVDDDKLTNAVNSRLIEESQICESIIVKESVLDAMKFLTLAGDEIHPLPSLIFLDLNMPGLSGKDFLAVSHELARSSNKPFVLIFLSSSTDEKENEEIASASVVKEFIHKPLTEDKLKEVIGKYFSS